MFCFLFRFCFLNWFGFFFLFVMFFCCCFWSAFQSFFSFHFLLFSFWEFEQQPDKCPTQWAAEMLLRNQDCRLWTTFKYETGPANCHERINNFKGFLHGVVRYVFISLSLCLHTSSMTLQSSLRQRIPGTFENTRGFPMQLCRFKVFVICNSLIVLVSSVLWRTSYRFSHIPWVLNCKD